MNESIRLCLELLASLLNVQVECVEAAVDHLLPTNYGSEEEQTTLKVAGKPFTCVLCGGCIFEKLDSSKYRCISCSETYTNKESEAVSG